MASTQCQESLTTEMVLAVKYVVKTAVNYRGFKTLVRPPVRLEKGTALVVGTALAHFPV
jgi:hypothetical protein